jgi:hypothetical protein
MKSSLELEENEKKITAKKQKKRKEKEEKKSGKFDSFNSHSTLPALIVSPFFIPVGDMLSSLYSSFESNTLILFIFTEFNAFPLFDKLFVEDHQQQ